MVYTPDLNFNGLDSFTYTAFDGQDYSEAGIINIYIESVNDSPIIQEIPDQEIDEGGNFLYILSASDIDGDIL